MYDKELAKQILDVTRDRHPEPIGNLDELKEILNLSEKPHDDWRLALDALEADGLIAFDQPLRTGIDKYLQNFINLRVTRAGRLAA